VFHYGVRPRSSFVSTSLNNGATNPSGSAGHDDVINTTGLNRLTWITGAWKAKDDYTEKNATALSCVQFDYTMSRDERKKWISHPDHKERLSSLLQKTTYRFEWPPEATWLGDRNPFIECTLSGTTRSHALLKKSQPVPPQYALVATEVAVSDEVRDSLKDEITIVWRAQESDEGRRLFPVVASVDEIAGEGNTLIELWTTQAPVLSEYGFREVKGIETVEPKGCSDR
jgi:hypothetical protein